MQQIICNVLRSLTCSCISVVCRSVLAKRFPFNHSTYKLPQLFALLFGSLNQVSPDVQHNDFQEDQNQERVQQCTECKYKKCITVTAYY